MKHVYGLTKISSVPKPAASAPFAKVCLMSGGSLEDGGDTCVFNSEASRSLFELLAGIKGVPYS